MLNFLTKTLVVISVTTVRNLTAFESVQRLTSITVQNVMSFTGERYNLPFREVDVMINTVLDR